MLPLRLNRSPSLPRSGPDLNRAAQWSPLVRVAALASNRKEPGRRAFGNNSGSIDARRLPSPSRMEHRLSANGCRPSRSLSTIPKLRAYTAGPNGQRGWQARRLLPGQWKGNLSDACEGLMSAARKSKERPQPIPALRKSHVPAADAISFTAAGLLESAFWELKAR